MEGPLYQQADLRDRIFNEVNSDLTRRCENALDLAALTVLHAVSVLIDGSSHPDLEIFRIFEEAISILTEKMTSSLKRFRTTGFRNRYADDDIELKASTIRARHKREDKRDEEENQDNTSALLELRDIEDELSTLKHLFGEQGVQVTNMLRLYDSYYPPHTPGLTRGHSAPVISPMSSSGATISAPMSAGYNTQPPFGGYGRGYLVEAQEKLQVYSTQAEDMIDRVKKTREDFDKLLTTVQRQAQIDEVRLSRQQADLASAQERSVMIFTVFTVIFLPLSFFSSIFGMNTSEWGGENNLGLRTIGLIALPSSAVLIFIALLVAWSTSMRKVLNYPIKRLRRYRRRMAKWGKKRIRSLWYRDLENRTPRLQVRTGRRKVKKQIQGAKVSRTNTGGQDFWEKHRRQREDEYQIPKSNLRSTYVKGSKAKKIAKRQNI